MPISFLFYFLKDKTQHSFLILGPTEICLQGSTELQNETQTNGRQ